MFRIAICDDSPADLQIISDYLEEFGKGTPLFVSSFSSGVELVAHYKSKHDYDLIILDMMMDRMSGIEAAKRIRLIDEDVVILIVTATIEYAIEGYTVNAARYIVKPVDKREFLKTLHNIFQVLEKRQEAVFTFPSKSGITRMSMEDIYYFESDIRMMKVVSRLGTYTFTGRISMIEEQTREHGFIRIHKSFIANMGHIHNIYKESVTMDNQDVLPLSKHKHKEVQQHFLDYVEGELV